MNKINLINKNLILIGFQGSKPKHMKKYKKMYNNFGFKNIDIIYPSYLHNYDVRKVQPLAIDIHNKIIKNDKTIIHCMSGGMYPLSYSLKYLMLSDKLNKLDSLILDSSPVDPSHDSLVNAFMKHNNLKYLKSLFDIIFKFYYKSIFLELDTWSYDFNFLMNSKKFNTPKLFIYSKNDIIAPFNYINSMANTHKKNGNITHQLIFEKSDHVKHICTDNLKYEKTIFDFLNKIE